MKKITLLTMLIVLAAIGYSWGPGMGEGPKLGRPDWTKPNDKPVIGQEEFAFFDELDLTADQMEQMEKIRLEQAKTNIKLHSQIELLEIDKREALKNHDFKNAKLLTDKIYEIKLNLAKNRIETRKKRWDVLTSEQKEQVDQLRLERSFHRKYMHRFEEMKPKMHGR